MLEALLAVWPVVVALAGLAVAWGGALVRISDLKQRVTDLEKARERERERVAQRLDELAKGLARIEGMLAAAQKRAEG